MHGKNSEEFFTHAWAYSETPSYPLFLLLKLTYNICCYFSIVNSLVLDSNFCLFLNQLSSSLLLEKNCTIHQSFAIYPLLICPISLLTFPFHQVNKLQDLFFCCLQFASHLYHSYEHFTSQSTEHLCLK